MDSNLRFDAIPYSDLSKEETWTELGKGSFGSVCLGEYLGLPVAIKQVQHSTEYDVAKYFQRECTILREARHPNIVQYLGLSSAPPLPSQHQKRILIISEFVPRGNLRSYLHSHSLPFPWRLRLSFATDVSRAVAYLHARNCLHRDLKGENLLVTENERLKVCDFGFARLAAMNEQEQRRMSYCGTDGYMAPEIITGDDFGLPADIFSLGCIFVEILSRQLINGEIFQRHPPSFTFSVAEIHSLASPSCPPSFIALTLACLSELPRNRPTIRSILDSLRTIEAEVVEREKGNGYSVGSMSFAGTKRAGGGGVVSGSRKMPDFSGVGSQRAATDEEDDEDIDLAMMALAEVGIPSFSSFDGSLALTPRRSSIINNDPDGVDESSSQHLPAPPSSATGDTVNNHSRSEIGSTFGRSSTITLKQGFAPPHLLRERPSNASLPSIPSAWMRYAATGSPIDAVSVESAEPTGQAEEITTAEMSSISIRGQRSNEEPLLPSSTSPRSPDLVLVSPNAPSSSIATIEEDGVTVDAAEEDDVFHSAIHSFPSPSSLPARQPTLEALSSSPMLHRFSLIKPGWNWRSISPSPTFTTSDSHSVSPLSTATPSAPIRNPDIITEVTRARKGGGGGEDEGLWGVFGNGKKCELCEKKFGWMKAYFQCDDCGYRCHLKCSDAAPTSCETNDQHLFAPPPAPLSSSSRRLPSTGSKLASKLLGMKLKKLGGSKVFSNSA